MALTKIGTVISDKMEKTVVVKTTMRIIHPLYKKQVTKFRKFKAHDELGAKLGDTVKIMETKPFSKSVYFKVTEITKKEK